MAHERLTIAADTLTRRTALWFTARVTMVAGLVGSYGLFAWVGARFMLPARIGFSSSSPTASRSFTCTR